ncbi:sigma-70 family RNA polymerase sigma factor [Bremerella sp. JC817]|uniref:RNA polymerase sigma factor n=1 Tax=Bremerella sp. JC817 TaxID=3231756 RepID=UPI00345899C1
MKISSSIDAKWFLMVESDVVRCLLEARIRLTVPIWSIVRESQTVEDIFQEVVLRALKQHDQFTDEGHLMAWSRTTAKNLAVDFLRQRGKSQVMDAGVMDRIWTISDEDSQGLKERQDALRNCLKTVPPRQREMIRLRYGEGLSCGEVATRIGTTLDAVYKRLSRTHSQLRKCVEVALQGETS